MRCQGYFFKIALGTRLMVEESKYCSGVMKKHFHNGLVITKKDDQNFKNSTKCWICDNDYVGGGVKVRDHCHIMQILLYSAT